MAKVKDIMDLLKTFIEQFMKDKTAEPTNLISRKDVGMTILLKEQERTMKNKDPYQNTVTYNDSQKLKMLISFEKDPVSQLYKVEQYF